MKNGTKDLICFHFDELSMVIWTNFPTFASLAVTDDADDVNQNILTSNIIDFYIFAV